MPSERVARAGIHPDEARIALSQGAAVVPPAPIALDHDREVRCYLYDPAHAPQPATAGPEPTVRPS